MNHFKKCVLLLPLLLLAGCTPRPQGANFPLDIAGVSPAISVTAAPTPLPTPESTPLPTPEPTLRDRAQELKEGFFTRLINHAHRLDAAYVPEGLVLVRENNPLGIKLKRRDMRANGEALGALNRMLTAAAADGVEEFYLVSVYRTFEEQQALFDKKVQENSTYGADPGIPLITAYAGASEHQTGLAFDITAQSAPAMSMRFAGTPHGQWLYAHCHEYGFILRYQEGKEDITKIVFEPWHLRYVGEELALYLTEEGLTLEEFYFSPNSY